MLLKEKSSCARTFTENNDEKDERRKCDSSISVTLHQEWMESFDNLNKVEVVF